MRPGFEQRTSWDVLPTGHVAERLDHVASQRDTSAPKCYDMSRCRAKVQVLDIRRWFPAMGVLTVGSHIQPLSDCIDSLEFLTVVSSSGPFAWPDMTNATDLIWRLSRFSANWAGSVPFYGRRDGSPSTSSRRNYTNVSRRRGRPRGCNATGNATESKVSSQLRELRVRQQRDYVRNWSRCFE